MSTRTKPRSRGRAPQGRNARTRKTPVVWLGLAVVVALAAVLAFAMGGGEATEGATVEVEGQDLPRLEEPATSDIAMGQQPPTLRGTGIDGQPLTIEPGGEPMVVLLLAHWCPVCQDEVPRIQEWIDAGGQPDGVRLVAVASDTDSSRPNHPPSDWLREQDWSVPTLLDDRGSPAGQAYGLSAFPFWTFLDAEGSVVARHAGALPVETLEQAMRQLGDL